MKRIFVRGVSRSGGTLMATVLDAHPDVAMCYEVYEHLLKPAGEHDDGVAAFTEALELDAAPKGRRLQPGAATKTAVATRLHRFIVRAHRGGVDRPCLARLLAEHVEHGGAFSTFAGRMRFIERLALEKARREGKAHWGAKITSTYRDLLDLYDDVSFLFMLRDGRDVAASRKTVGDFKKSVGEIAKGWVRQIEIFQRFVDDPGVNARFVGYEALTTEPERELRGILAFLGLPWSDHVLHHDRQELTIYRNPTGHLSGQQVRGPIRPGSVGRWKTDLSAAEVAEFESVAGEVLAARGYATEQIP